MDSWKGVSHLLVCVIPFGILWNAIQLRFSSIQLLFLIQIVSKIIVSFLGTRLTLI